MLRFLILSLALTCSTLAASLGALNQDSMTILQDVLSYSDQQRPKPTPAASGSAISGSAVKYNVINEYLGAGDGYDRPKAPLPTVMPSTGGKGNCFISLSFLGHLWFYSNL